MGISSITGLVYWDENSIALNSGLKRSIELSQHKESLNYLQFLPQARSGVRAGAIYLSVVLATRYDLANNLLKRSVGFLHLAWFEVKSNLHK